MRYVGGKARIANFVEQSILGATQLRQRYVEPFLGSGVVLSRMRPHFAEAFASDSHEDLMMMWKSVRDGVALPTHCSKERYEELRKSGPSPERGLVGFGSSFSGKWFGGFVDTVYDKHHKRITKPYLLAAHKSVYQLRDVLKKTILEHCSYEHVPVHSNDVVYCDPPYKGTLGYRDAGPFDHQSFWKKAEEWTRAGAFVVVSESMAPENWRVLAERTRKSMLRVAGNEENTIRSERLYVLDT